MTYFRSIHTKNALKSVLAQIEGIGKQKSIALMQKFSNVGNIMNASEEEIASTEGIGAVLAKKIKDYLNNNLK